MVALNIMNLIAWNKGLIDIILQEYLGVINEKQVKIHKRRSKRCKIEKVYIFHGIKYDLVKNFLKDYKDKDYEILWNTNSSPTPPT